MKNKKVVVSSANINTGMDIVIDPSISWVFTSPAGATETQKLYPISIQIVNNCGATIEFNAFTSQQDFDTYWDLRTAPDIDDYYAFVPVPKTGILQNDHTNFPSCYRFVIRGVEATATTDLEVVFINYSIRL